MTAQVACEPRTLNLKSEGKWIECTIELPPPNRPQDIDLRSVKLNGKILADPKRGEIEDDNHNGIPELEVKFSRSQVEAILSVGQAVPLILTGTVSGISFSGSTTIRVISQGKPKEKEKEDKDKKKDDKGKGGKETERDDDRKKSKGQRSAVDLPKESDQASLPDLSAVPQLASLTLLELGPILAQTVISQSAPSEVLLYVHTDHLGTPVMMTDEQGQTVWEADAEPFGQTTITAQPGVTLNLRFPGQYFDSETGLHYNYFRDYDPSTGRYMEPDPFLPFLGLAGSPADLNPYPYSSNGPVSFVDPYGTVDWKGVGQGLLTTAVGASGFGLAIAVGIPPTAVGQIAGAVMLVSSGAAVSFGTQQIVAALADNQYPISGSKEAIIRGVTPSGLLQRNLLRANRALDLAIGLYGPKLAQISARGMLTLLEFIDATVELGESGKDLYDELLRSGYISRRRSQQMGLEKQGDCR